MYYYENIPEELKQRIMSWKSLKSSFLEEAKRAEEYFLSDVEGTGTNYTIEQYQKIKDVTNIPLSINYLYPAISQEHAILSQLKPGLKVISASGSKIDNQIAAVAEKITLAIMYNSQSFVHFSEAIKEMLVKGMSHICVTEDIKRNIGEFPIKVIHLPVEFVTIDPNSFFRTNEDMSGYFIEKEIAMEDFIEMFGAILQIISDYYQIEIKYDDFSKPTSSVNEKVKLLGVEFAKKNVNLIKYYDKVYTEMFYVRDPDKDIIIKTFKENYFPEQVDLFINDETIVNREEGKFVRETIIAGDKVLCVRILPIKDFPIKTLYYEWGGRPYKSKGVYHFTKSMQDALDKSIQLLILNGILSNNAGWIAPIGSIPPEQRENWSKYANDPTRIKEYMPVVLEGNILRPEREPIANLGNYYPYIMELMKSSIEYVTGINPVVHGNPSDQKIEVFKTLQQYQNAAIQRITTLSNYLKTDYEYICNVVIQYVSNGLEPDEYYGFFTQDQIYDEVTITKEMINTLNVYQHRILAIMTESFPTQKMAQAAELLKIAQTTPDAYERKLYVRKAFELSNIRAFDELEKELNEINILRQQIAALEEQIARDKELMKQYENRALLAEYKARLANVISKAELAVKTEAEKAKLKLQIDMLEEENNNLD